MERPRYTFRISDELRARLQAVADNDRRTLSNMICMLLESAVERYEFEHGLNRQG